MVYGNGVTSVETVPSLFKMLRAGILNLEDEERCDHPWLIAMVEENTRYAVREIVRNSMNHLTKLGYINRSYVNRSDVWLSHELTDSNNL